MKSLWCGALLLMVYDGLRIFRKVIPHRPAAAALEDSCSGRAADWICCPECSRTTTAPSEDIPAGSGARNGRLALLAQRIFGKKLTKILRMPIKKILILLKRLKF